MAGWLSAAEGFLNKLDKSAADALSGIDDQPSFNIGGINEKVDSENSSPFITSSQNVPSRLHELRTSRDPASSLISSPIRQSTPKSKTDVKSSKSETKSPALSKSKEELKKKDSDEALFEFLNSKDPVENNKRKTPTGSQQHSRQSSTSSIGKSLRSVDVALPVTTSVPVSVTTVTDSRQESPTGSHDSPDIDVLADALHESPAVSVHSSQESDNNHTESTQHISSLELENRLLRNEVSSLNTEMASLLARSKDSQKELENVKKQIHSSASQNDQIIRELRARENDLTEALTAKDSQLAILRVRLEEGDNTVTNLKQQIDELQSQRTRILQDHTDSSGMHSQALDSLKEKLVEVEAALKREKEAYKQSQQEATERQSKLEQEQKALADALTQAERRAAEEKNKTLDVNNQLKLMKLNLETGRQELADYKDKASRILQSKDKLISSLREGGASGTEGSGISSIEFDSIKQERDMLKEELQQSKMLIENYKVELQDLEGQLQQESDTASEQIQSLEDNLTEEKRRREDSEQELLKQKQELQYAIDEINKQKTSFQSQLSARESEIDKLRNQLMTKSLSSVSETELESRVRALTESLIQKQTMLESLSTEKNSLALQLERLEQQYRDVQLSARSAPAHVHISDDDDVRQRVPTFMKEAAHDTEVTRRMKRAANGIDKFSIRLGIFLRRYPIARVFVILYMGLLHIWVMIVLLTYQPEVHDASHVQPQPPGTI